MKEELFNTQIAIKKGPNLSDILKTIEDLPPTKVMPYAFVMSIKYAKLFEEQCPAPKGSFFNFMGFISNGMKVFSLSNEKFKEICEKQPDINDSNRVFVFDNPLALDKFMVKCNIIEWEIVDDE